MKLQNVMDIKHNQYFIWADDYTREYMCVEDDERRLSVLVCKKNDKVTPKIHVTSLIHPGWSDELFWDKKCRVIIVDEPYQFMNENVRCDSCANTFCNHKMGQDARIDGIVCPNTYSEMFVPEEMSLVVWHPHEMSGREDFFASIGL